jgi:hypothetical protein
VVLADANPGIASLRTATMRTLDEFLAVPAAVPAGAAAEADENDDPREVARAADPRRAAPPNLGPPPERLDWRRGRY